MFSKVEQESDNDSLTNLYIDSLNFYWETTGCQALLLKATKMNEAWL